MRGPGTRRPESTVVPSCSSRPARCWAWPGRCIVNRGKWVDLGEYAIDRGKLSVKPHNRGEWGSGADGEGAHIVASHIRATCTAA
ncbi:hypothetical protein ACWDKQ_19380 [Saccharopolyspora sp. NPDC000995]